MSSDVKQNSIDAQINVDLKPESETVQITVAEQEQILEIQQKLFTMVAQNKYYIEVIEQLCSLAEQLLPNSVASIMVMDDEYQSLHVLAAPSVPDIAKERLDGLIPGPHGGSCGNAIYGNKPVYVQDTFSDDRWLNLRQIAYDFNLCACWSNPVKNSDGDAIGSFALSSFEHRLPSAFHKRILEIGANIVSIVLNSHTQQQILQQKQQRLALLGTAIESASEGVIITDANNRILEVNRFFMETTGYSLDEVRGKDPSILSSGHQSADFYSKMWDSLQESGHWNGEIVNRKKDGSPLPQWLSLSINKDEQGNILNYVAVFNDLSAIKKEQDKHVSALETDALTGLPNKLKLAETCGLCTGECSILVLNINNFSMINSSYGLDLADRLLISVADRLKTLIQHQQIYRLNADEFAILYSESVDLFPIHQKIKQYFYLNQINVDDISFNLNFTYGAATGNRDLLRKSLLALKKAKQEGTGRYHLFNSEHDESDQNERLEYIHWNTLLHRALKENCLVPYFQGIRNNKSGEIDHYETLIRMDIDGQIYGPYQFLQAAKLSGLFPTITRLVIDRSFAVMANYDCHFNINVTEEDLSQHFLVDYLKEKAEQYQVSPERVTLEILEGISSSGKKNHINQLSEIKSMGYKLAIDDFGTEYSNFERILELEVDFLKIDAKYIRNIDTDKTSYEITRAIVFFAKNAGIPVVAEFVHSQQVQTIIEQLDIEYSQGYLFSEPEPFA